VIVVVAAFRRLYDLYADVTSNSLHNRHQTILARRPMKKSRLLVFRDGVISHELPSADS
jgi:hypothetical protein